MIGRLRPARDERGAVIVIATLAMVAIITICAIAVDISMLRSDLRVNRSATDAAATAAALDLNGSTAGPANACAHAWNIALLNLRIDPTTATSPCASSFPAGAACAPTTPVDAVGAAGDVNITITIPVIDSSPLMSAQEIGGDQAQAINAVDGTPCQRVGVKIQRTRSSVFGGIAGITSGSTTVHSVARYNPSSNGGQVPALVALNKTACPSVDALSGNIHAFNGGAFPGIIDSDSIATASSCSSSMPFNANGPGTITADASTTGIPGQLGYSASSQSAAFSSSGTFTGTKTFELPVTRAPVDAVYHCGNLTPVPSDCTTGTGGTDAISDLQAHYATMTAASAGAAGFTVFPASGQTCATVPGTFAAGNWFINCPTFSPAGAVAFRSGNIVFAGNIALGSGAVLTINADNASTTAPTGTDSTVVIQGTGGMSTSSNTWLINWYRTTVLMTNSACAAGTTASCGTITMHDGGGTWTAPQAGETKGLIYWTETNQWTAFQGNPLLSWRGVFFAGSSHFDQHGNANLDTRDVQLWIDTVTMNNASAGLLLRPDPATGIGTRRAGTSLIR